MVRRRDLHCLPEHDAKAGAKASEDALLVARGVLAAALEEAVEPKVRDEAGNAQDGRDERGIDHGLQPRVADSSRCESTESGEHMCRQRKK
eukprot:6182474-Pleurochrysis_carterae.AAC.2